MNTLKKPSIGVLGAGAWGTTIANLLSKKNDEILIWAREEKIVKSINQNHINTEFLSGIKLNENIKASSNLSEFSNLDFLFVVVPTQYIGSTMKQLKNTLNSSCKIINASKGIDIQSLKLISEIIKEIFPKNKISVLLSTYNDEATIQESIQSILNQTYENFELLIKIDGSSDNTYKIINEFTDKRITVFNSEKNNGLTKSLNFLAEQSTGEYLARQDADDISLVSRFDYQLNEFENNKYKKLQVAKPTSFNNTKMAGSFFGWLPLKKQLKIGILKS